MLPRRLLLVLTMSLLAATGCGSGEPEGADTPQETLTRLTAFITDDEGEEACNLMSAAAQELFARGNEMSTCEQAVNLFHGKITDRDAYRQMVPTGLKTEGDEAEVSGYCGKGWTHPDGADPSEDPNSLGTLTLRKTENGWLIQDYVSSREYSSCGG
ncbi:hypothetical protein [Planobispora longispora]|uniref:Lipoprotein n=1 Tax=Planobispora longispora TaxID=28887 RepID=A0A8J3RX62_9ACTN|nr:hypothetical protein [Planobispora longispora]BFE88576.1 hypothetical protein GCM10020093_111770 [Planobispora longispora]GIH81144.1 hypothetical protein Plo01_75730 [Planobispora longispora]